MTCIAIVGVGGQARLSEEIAFSQGFRICSRWTVAPSKVGLDPVDGDCEKVAQSNHSWIIALGDGKLRKKAVAILRAKFRDPEFPTLISPSACIWTSAKVGAGCIVLPFSNLGANSEIGEFCIINTQANIEHDANIGDYSHAAPASTILGGASVGSLCLVGAGSVIAPNVCLPNFSTLGALSFLKDSADHPGIYVGIPATRIR